MALHLRKSFSEAVTDLCDPYCDDSNESTLCPTSCLSLCPDFCKIDLFSVPPTYADYDPPDPSPEGTHLSLTRVVLIAVSAAIAVIVVAALFLKARQRRRRRGQDPSPPGEEERMDREFLDQDRGPAAVEHHIWYINTVGLTQSVIDSIAVCRYKSGEGLVEGTECSVCLTEFVEDETLRLLPKCSHAFHVPCIDTWLRSHTTCPLCRAPIVRSTDGDVTVTTGEEDEESLTFEEEGEEEEQGRGTEEDAENRGEKEETQPIRRSVSMDSISALKINLAVSNPFREGSERNSISISNTDSQVETGENRVVMRKLSPTTSSQRGSSSSLIRSLSCSGRLFLSAHGRSRSRSRSRSSILPM